MIKKFAAVALPLVLSLAACGQKSETSGTEQSAPAASQSDTGSSGSAIDTGSSAGAMDTEATGNATGSAPSESGAGSDTTGDEMNASSPGPGPVEPDIDAGPQEHQ
jgi:hypothetical protein